MYGGAGAAGGAGWVGGHCDRWDFPVPHAIGCVPLRKIT